MDTLLNIFSGSSSRIKTTPYFTNIIGATASFAGVLAIMRTYILQFICGPTGGILADKAKSISKVVVGCYILILASLVVIVVLPSDASTMIPMVILMILLCAAIFAMRGIYFATIDEANIPRHVTGTAIGIVFFIGFTPDVFVSPICGKLLDAYDGAAGYRAIFFFDDGVCCYWYNCSNNTFKNLQEEKEIGKSLKDSK